MTSRGQSKALPPLGVGVLSDTHGLLRREAITALEGVDHILHAGDVGDPAILKRLRLLAPLTAIRGNVDEHGLCSHLPPTEVVELAGHSFYMLHDGKALDLDPAAAGFAAIVSGHSHKPLMEWRRGVLYFNPGSAGPRRFSLPVSLGLIEIDREPAATKSGSPLRPRIVNLAVDPL